jgi:hypothetical protein
MTKRLHVHEVLRSYTVTINTRVFFYEEVRACRGDNCKAAFTAIVLTEGGQLEPDMTDVEAGILAQAFMDFKAIRAGALLIGERLILPGSQGSRRTLLRSANLNEVLGR